VDIHVDLTTDTSPVRNPLLYDLTPGKESSSEDKVDIIHVDLTTDTSPVRNPLLYDLTSGKESSSEDKESVSDSDSDFRSDRNEEPSRLQCHKCSNVFSTKSNLRKHQRLISCAGSKRKLSKAVKEKHNEVNMDFSNARRLLPSLWSKCKVEKRESLPYDINGDCVYELPYDEENMMDSSSDGRPWKQWNTSKRQGFEGRRRVTSCGGTYVCKNSRCPYLHSYGKQNDVQFKRRAEDEVVCNCCGYEAKGVMCNAKKVWEFGQDKVTVFHCGEHNCSVKERDPDIREAATTFFRNNTAAKPSQFPYQHLRGLLKEGKSVEDVYKEAKGMANLKKIQNIKQKVVEQENPVGHSFEALATIKESTDLKDKYLLWSVKDGRVADITAVFRSSEERLEIANQMQRNGSTHPLANEFCFLDAEHDKVKGLKTINLSVQHPLLKEMVTIASMDCLTESTETLSEFWKQLNSALREYTGEANYIFDPEGIVTDEHGGNRESVRRELNEGMVERTKSCEMHFYGCAHKVTKATWSTQSRKKFITMIHGIYTAETPGSYEAKRRALFEWAADKPKRAHVKAWFNNFWHVRRFHVFRSFKSSHAPNTNMTEVGHSRNATRGAKNDTLARVAEDHVVESAILKAKLESFLNGTYQGGRCPDQKKKDQLSLRRQLDRAIQFANEVRSGSIDTSHYDAGPFMSERSRHRARNADLCSSSDDELPVKHRNAKKAHRVRPTRSKKFEESLKMAKRAKITLVGTHDVSATKKIFELNDAGKIRLAEISETVSCNCSFARGSDICLHIIWAASLGTLIGTAAPQHNLRPSQTQAASLGTLIETAAPQHNLRPSQTQAASLGTLKGTAAPQHNLRPSQTQAVSLGTLIETAAPQHNLRPSQAQGP
ncbi:Transposon Tf2-6 poly, partial [Paramuricea clavata]